MMIVRNCNDFCADSQLGVKNERFHFVRLLKMNHILFSLCVCVYTFHPNESGLHLSCSGLSYETIYCEMYRFPRDLFKCK
jgi:hypothetical protein